MAYTSATLSKVVEGGYLRTGIWLYDTVDATATIDTAGYISDASTKGMLKGDLVIGRIWTTAVPAATSELQTAAGTANVLTAMGFYIVGGISTAGAADLFNVLAITVTNTD